MAEENERTNSERSQDQELMRRVNRHLRVLIECNEAMVHINEERLLLQEICRIITEIGGYIFAWVGFAMEDEKKSIHPVAYAGKEEGFLQSINITWADTELGRGPTGTSIRTGKPFLSRDIADDERFAPWRQEALKRGYRATLGIPLFCEEGTCGAVLNIYAADSEAFDTEEVKLLSELGRDLGYGIRSIRQRVELKASEEVLRESEERLKLATRSSNIGLFDWDLRTNKVYFSPEWKRQIGYREDEISDNFDEWKSRVHPDDLDKTLKIVDVYIKNPYFDFEVEFRFRHKDGSYRWVMTQGSLLKDESGKPIRMLGSHIDITELKKAEAKLQEEYSFRNSVIESAAEGLAVCHAVPEYPFVRFTLWNNKMTEITGYTIEEINQKGWYQTVYPDSEYQEKARKRMDRMREGDNLVSEKWEITRADGEKRILEISTSVLVSAEGVIHILALMHDVTENRKAQEQILIANERLHYLLSSTTGAIYSSRACCDYGATFISDNVRDIVGYEAKEFLRAPMFWLEHIHPDDYQHVLAMLEGIKEKSRIEYEYRFRHKDGNYIWIRDEFKVIRDKDGNPVECVGYWANITEHKEMEEALIRIEEAIESSGEAIAMADTEGKHFYQNKAFTELFGYTIDELKEPIIAYADHNEGKEVFETIMSGDSWQGEVMMVSKSGRRFPVLLRANAVKDERGRIIGLIGIHTDITRIKEAEDSLKKLVLSSFGDLVSKMSHELSNPLMIISGNAQLCLMEGSKDKELENNLKVIVEQTDRAKDIIQKMINFSNPGGLELKDVNINDTLESAVKSIEDRYKLSNVSITRDYGQRLPVLRIDEKKMKEAFLNILENSFESMPAGGTITIATSAPKDTVQIIMTDTGRGMSKETLEKIFEPFFSTKEKGIGMGLPICYAIVRSHGGQIHYESQPGEGSSAIISLPLK